MSEQSDNNNNNSNNKRPRFSIPSAAQVYSSNTPPPTINTFQKASDNTTPNELEQNKTFSNVAKESETVLKRTFSNITTSDGTTQTVTKTTLETTSGGDTVKRFSNITTTTQTNSNTSSVSSTSTSTYKPPQKPTSLPRPAEPTAGKFGPGGSIHVNPCQRGNPILSNVRAVPWEYKDIVPDYVVGKTTCVLYLSLKYHKLYPDYIFQRVQKLRSNYQLRIILCRVDIPDPDRYLLELTKLTMNANLTLFLSWNDEEAGHYLESFKLLETSPPTQLKEKQDLTPLAQFSDCLTKVRGVNKTDCLTLASNFGSFKNLLEANMNNLALCPGFGLLKAQRLRNALDAPFNKEKSD